MFTVAEAMNDTGRLTVREAATGDTYEVSQFADELLRERLKTLAPGSRVQLELRSGEVPTVTRLLPATPLEPFGAD